MSSTFVDMDEERDILKDIVEPKLNEFLVKHLCSVEFVDLRHSVKTDNSKTLLEREQAIFNICLEEIDNCVPYFIGIIGHRYGWVPADDGVPCPDINIPDDFPIPKEKLSVTMYEFLHGFFVPEIDNQRCLLFMRSEDSYTNITGENLKNYIESDEKRNYNKLIRKYIRDKSGRKCIGYTFRLNSDSQEETLHCAELLYDSLLKFLEPEYSTSVENEHTRFVAARESFVEKHLRNFVGREKELKECIRNISDTKSICIYSPLSGNDTTSLFCKLYDIYRHQKDTVCFFFCYSGSDICFEDIIYHWLKDTSDNEDNDRQLDDARNDRKKLEQIWKRTIQSYLNLGKRVIVFNNYLSINKPLFDWCAELNVRFFSVIQDSYGKDFPNLGTYKLGPYDDATIQEVIAPLRPEVRKALLVKDSVRTPQWLRIAIGIIERMTKSDFSQIRTRSEIDSEEKICRYQVELVEDMPDDTEDLLQYRIDKLKTLIDGDFVDQYLMLLSLSLSVNENRFFDTHEIGPFESALFDPHLGWDENYLAEIFDTELSNIVALRQMLGADIICKTIDGLWNFADADLHEWISSNYSISKYRPILQKAYSFVCKLPDTDPIAAQTRFKLALINGDTDYCADIIQEDYRRDTEFKDISHRGLWWFATTYEQPFKSMLHTMMNDQRHWNYDFFFNLLHWLPILKRQIKYYLLLLEVVINRIRSLWIDKKIDLYTYSSIVEAYASEIETYDDTENFSKMHECLEYGIQLSRDYCAENENFLNFYHFALWRMTGFFETFDTVAPFLDNTIIRDEKADKYHYPLGFESSSYCALLHYTAKILTLTNKVAEAEPFSLKAFNLQFQILGNIEDRTMLSVVDKTENIVHSLKETLILHYHYGLLQRPMLLSLIDKAYPSLKENVWQNDYQKFKYISEVSRIVYAQSLFLQDMPLSEKIKNLDTFQQSTLYYYIEIRSDKTFGLPFIYLLLNHNIAKNIWLHCQSLLLYLMSFNTILTLPLKGTTFYLDDGSIGETDRRTFKAMQAQTLTILYAMTSLANNEIDETLARNMLIVYLAMLRGEWADPDPDINLMVQLYNSCRELLDELQDATVYPQAFDDDLAQFHDIIEHELKKLCYHDLDTSGFFDLQQWWNTHSPDKNIQFL